MTNLNPAANPAKFPRATSAKTTEYVCTNPDNVCDLNCYECPYYVTESEAVSMSPDEIKYLRCEDCQRVFDVWPGTHHDVLSEAICECGGRLWGLTASEHATLVTEPANQVEAGVTKSATGPFAARDLNRCDDCGHLLLTDSEDYLYCPICYRPELVTEPAGRVEPGVTKPECSMLPSCTICGKTAVNGEECPYCGEWFCVECAKTGHTKNACVLVTEPAGQVEAGVTKEADPCISPPQFVDVLACQQKINRPYQTMHFFHSWDEIDQDITHLVNDFRIDKLWDIFAWRFAGSTHWFDDMCYIPDGLCIEVRWGCINV